MTNEDILKNKPEGAKHFSKDWGCFYKRNSLGKLMYSNLESNIFSYDDDEDMGPDVRLLDDIKEIVELKKLLSKIRDDLLIRSEERDSEGMVVVNLGSSLWNRLNEVIDSDG